MTDEARPPGEADGEGGNGEAEPPKQPARPARPGEGDFELESLREDVEERLKPAPPLPPPPVRPAPETEDEVVDPPARPPWETEDEVDTRTVAERRGQAVELHAGRRPPPPDWPVEAFSFPLRGDRVGLGIALGVWVLLDLVAWWNPFVGVTLKVLAYVFFLRWQLSVATTSASGQDVPTPFARVSDIDMEGLKALGRLVAIIVALALPGIALLLLHKTAAGVFLLVAGLLWAGVAALGAVVGEPSLVLPWKAFPWMGARPLGLLAATVGWVVAVGVEWFEGTQAGIGPFPAIVLALVLRAAFVYLWLVSARALGVVGRAWSPYAEEDDPAVGA